MKARRSLFYSLCLYTALVQSTLAAVNTFTWTGLTSSVWTDPTNWSPPGFPQLPTDIAVFPHVLTTDLVHNDGLGLSVGSLNFTASDNYTITGNLLELNNLPNPATINASSSE